MTRPEVEAARAARDGALPARVEIEPGQVEYLALEGGGGKGMAYLGALQALEELGGTAHLKGCAGASAGAITALLLVLGYDAKRLATYLTGTDFSAFFDPPSPRLRPTVGAPYAEVGDDDADRGELERFKLSGLGLIPPLLRAIGPYAEKEPYKSLLEHHDQYITYLSADMGVFSGVAARDAFVTVIREAIKRRWPDLSDAELARHGPITFAHLEELGFDRELVLTGSNLSTGRTELFSSRHTPNFPVADAVRISMGLPFIYKPYVLTESPRGHPPCGTYVDGGLWNNLPYRDAALDGAGADSTLSLRLEITPPERVESLVQLLTRVATFGLFGTGESQVLRSYEVKMITLDTRGLDLIDFRPPAKALEAATKRSARTVFLAFGQPPPARYRDLRDDIEGERARRAADVCGRARPSDVIPR